MNSINDFSLTMYSGALNLRRRYIPSLLPESVDDDRIIEYLKEQAFAQSHLYRPTQYEAILKHSAAG